MMRTVKKLITILLCILMAASVFTVSAKEVEYAPYSGYEYNGKSSSVAAPISYTYKSTINGIELGLETGFVEPSDMCYVNDVLYILDSGNSRVVKLNKDFELVGVVENFVDKDGSTLDFTGAKGIAVAKDGSIYIADTANLRVIHADSTGAVIKMITKPDTNMVGYTYSFDAIKVLVNSNDNILVSVQSVNNGAFVFSPEGEFLNFFGRSTVQRTIDVLLNFIKKQFMTREQIQKQQNYAPATISNLDVDKEGFIYTVTRTRTTTATDTVEVRKLNYKGQNIAKVEGIMTSYGDLENDNNKLTSNDYTSFIDIEIDSKNFVHLLDEGRGKVFQYTQNGQMIAVYGGYGAQKGMFSRPEAIETIDDTVLVLDAQAGELVTFVPTNYLAALRDAFVDLDTSDPQKAITLWTEVLQYNTNSQYPYYGLGMAYEKLGDYETAMGYFKLASTKGEYSDAFYEYRKQYVRENILWMVAVAILAIAVIVLVSRYIKKLIIKKSNGAFSVMENKYTIPFYVLLHPSDGFAQFKYRKGLTSYLPVGIILALFFLVNVFSFFFTGYIFNMNEPQDYTIFSTVVGSIGLFALFVVGNWCICSLMDGNGKMKEICCVTAYAFIPYIVCQFVNILLSNVLSQDEAMFLTIISVIGIVWTALVLIIGLSQIHQYYIGKTIATLLLSIFAAVIIAVIVFVLFSLMQQVLHFFSSIYTELQLR